MTTNRQETYRKIADYLTTMFEVPAEAITPDALLVADLDLDSIDAVDLMVKLQETTGHKVSPAQFGSVKTVQDLVDLVDALSAKV